MKRLILLRHSKAGQTNKKILDDHERTLTDKGKDLCENIASYMKSNNYNPDLIISSSSVRTVETSELIIKNADLTGRLIVEQKLYLAHQNELFKTVQTIDESIETAMIVAHNPGIQNFSIELSGSGDKKIFRKMRGSFPPASMAIFEINEDYWFNTSTQSGHLLDFTTNKSLEFIE